MISISISDLMNVNMHHMKYFIKMNGKWLTKDIGKTDDIRNRHHFYDIDVIKILIDTKDYMHAMSEIEVIGYLSTDCLDRQTYLDIMSHSSKRNPLFDLKEIVIMSSVDELERFHEVSKVLIKMISDLYYINEINSNDNSWCSYRIVFDVLLNGLYHHIKHIIVFDEYDKTMPEKDVIASEIPEICPKSILKQHGHSYVLVTNSSDLIKIKLSYKISDQYDL